MANANWLLLAEAFIPHLFVCPFLATFQAVVDCGALDCLVTCLEEFDPGVREAAAWALGYVAGHSADLAGTVRSAPPGPFNDPNEALGQC